MTTHGANVVRKDPIREGFKALAQQISAGSDIDLLTTTFKNHRKTLTPKELGFALIEATQKGNDSLVSFFLKECGESELSIEDLLTAFEMAILINNPKTLTPFHNHFAKGSSPRTPKHKKEHLETLYALQIANGDTAKLYDPSLSEFSIRKALWVTGLSGNIPRFTTILKHARVRVSDKVVAFEKVVAAGMHAILGTLLENSKQDIDPITLGIGFEKAAENNDYRSIVILYEHCAEKIPLSSIGLALEKVIDRKDKLTPLLLPFILQKSGPNIPAQHIETALQAAIWREKKDAFNLLLGLKNTGPEQRKLAIIAAFNAKKEEIYHDARFTLRERIAALGLSVYLLKMSEDMKVKRPWASQAALFASRFVAAVLKALKTETSLPAKTQESISTTTAPPSAMATAPVVSVTTTDPAVQNTLKSALRFSAPPAPAAAPSDTSVPPPPTKKETRKIGWSKSVVGGE